MAEPKPDLQEVDGDGPCPRCKGTQQDIPESDVTIRHCQGCDTTWRVRLRLKARPPS